MRGKFLAVRQAVASGGGAVGHAIARRVGGSPRRTLHWAVKVQEIPAEPAVAEVAESAGAAGSAVAGAGSAVAVLEGLLLGAPPALPPVQDGDDDSSDDHSVHSTWTQLTGNSTYEDSEIENTDGAPAAPADTEERDTTPVEPKQWRRSDVLNDREDVGNNGWVFGNWGQRAKNQDIKDHISIHQITRYT